MRAQTAQQRGDYASAANAYLELAQLRPEMGEIWANLGLMYQFMGDYSRADKNFHLALARNSHLYVPNLFLGLNRLRGHEPRAALPFLTSAASLNREDEQVALALGRAYAAIHDSHDSTRWFARATDINPQDVDAWYSLGLSYLNLQQDAVTTLRNRGSDTVYARTLIADAFMQQGRINDAIPIYEQFRSETHPPCLKSKLGLAYAQVSADDKARQAFSEERNSRTGCPLARLGLARLAMKSGDIAGALTQLQIVEKLEPNFLRSFAPEIWNGLSLPESKAIAEELRTPELSGDPMAAALAQALVSGDLGGPLAGGSAISAASTPRRRDADGDDPTNLAAEGRYSECAARIQRLKDPLSAAFTRLLEECSFYSANYKLTLATSERALKRTPDDLASLYWQAKSAHQLATASFAQMNVLAPESSKGHLLLAELHRAREEYSAAEQEYNDALKRDPSEVDKVNANLGLANVYLHDSDDNKAFGMLAMVLKSDPSNADAHFLMAQILVRRREYDDAVAHLKLAMADLSPESQPEAHSLLAKCYSSEGKNTEALQELKPALPADTLGTYHYQLYQIYRKLGDQTSATTALQKSEQLRKQKSLSEQQQTESRYH